MCNQLHNTKKAAGAAYLILVRYENSFFQLSILFLSGQKEPICSQSLLPTGVSGNLTVIVRL
jgi:hypothetical protein